MSRPIVRECGAAQHWDLHPIRTSSPDPGVVVGIWGTANPHPSHLSDPIAEAEDLIQLARQQAQQILEKARQEAAEIREAAARDGRADAETAAHHEREAERREIRQWLDGLALAFRECWESQTPALAALAIDIAEQLVGEHLEAQPQRVIHRVRQALAEVTACARVRVRVHPDDLHLLGAEPGSTDHPHAGTRQHLQIEWQPDPSLRRGDCRIESEQGEIDATVAGGLSRIARSLLED